MLKIYSKEAQRAMAQRAMAQRPQRPQIPMAQMAQRAMAQRPQRPQIPFRKYWEAVRFEPFLNEDADDLYFIAEWAVTSFCRMMRQKGYDVNITPSNDGYCDYIQESVYNIIRNGAKSRGQAMDLARQGVSKAYAKTAGHPMGLTGWNAGSLTARAENADEEALKASEYVPHNNADDRIYIYEFMQFLKKNGATVQIKVLNLRLKGYKNKEVAKILKISEKAVKTSVEKLKKSYGDFSEK